jgi:hypothetical protein
MMSIVYARNIRALLEADVPALIQLEREVWRRRGIESIDESVAERWINEGVCLGAFEGEKLVAYVYAETIRFAPIPPYSEEILAALQSYKATSPAVHGNALHGLSMASRRPGAGEPLLDALTEEASLRRLRYFVSLARLEGLGRFVDENPGLRNKNLQEVACLYAIQAVSWFSPDRIGPSLSLLAIPPEFPRIRRKDPVVSRFARLGKELWGVTESSFADPQSLGCSALLVLTL